MRSFYYVDNVLHTAPQYSPFVSSIIKSFRGKSKSALFVTDKIPHKMVKYLESHGVTLTTNSKDKGKLYTTTKFNTIDLKDTELGDIYIIDDKQLLTAQAIHSTLEKHNLHYLTNYHFFEAPLINYGNQEDSYFINLPVLSLSTAKVTVPMLHAPHYEKLKQLQGNRVEVYPFYSPNKYLFLTHEKLNIVTVEVDKDFLDVIEPDFTVPKQNEEPIVVSAGEGQEALMSLLDAVKQIESKVDDLAREVHQTNYMDPLSDFRLADEDRDVF